MYVFLCRERNERMYQDEIERVNDIKFSVLMSVYKNENPIYFDESIKSILNQTLVPNQIVIVCDGLLTEDLYKIVDKYKSYQPNIFKFVEYEKNQGLGNALNIGLKNCDYDYVARMDTDDIARNDRFEKQFDFLSKHPEISILGSSIAEFDTNINHIISYRKVPTTDYEIKKFAHKRNPFNHMTVVLKKQDVIDTGSYMDMPLAEDYYLWVRMFCNGYKGANINDNLVYARAGDEMVERRSGFAYAKKIHHLRYNLYKVGFLKYHEYVLYSICHCTIAVFPLPLKRIIYRKVLHKTDM